MSLGQQFAYATRQAIFVTTFLPFFRAELDQIWLVYRKESISKNSPTTLTLNTARESQNLDDIYFQSLNFLPARRTVQSCFEPTDYAKLENQTFRIDEEVKLSLSL